MLLTLCLADKSLCGRVGVVAMAKKVTSKYTEDFVPVKDIANGMIALETGEKVAGIKILPKNIFILDQDTQDAIIYNLKNVYNMIDYEFWIIVADRPVDIHVYLSNLQALYNDVTSPNRRKLIMQEIEKANMFMTNNVVDTEYFLLFKERKDDLITKRIRNLISIFANAGMQTQQTSNDDMRMILDNFLNGGQTTNFGTVIS